ncbi:Eco57I restriction-modification methylase domain-containing protein [Capnocytophaga sputigena]|uniref:Eco57I restriction-modification methylase domain-containing protein n=1 Tax=Capnocytophaga sputigena TaxID=1019 RepID=UPI001E2ECE01|nr:Eco57I restriction-modification methylase domain-containing protein [Capnocytophaga sputigena]
MKNLRQILSSPYHQEDWISFLKELFAHNSGTGVILQKPQRIELSKSEKVKEAYELGNYETTEGRLIGIYQVNISEDMLLYRNKVGLRQLMKNIYKYNVDGVLVVFVQEKKWRLSYISEIIKEVDEKGKIIKEITNEKRFTYLLGEGEKTKTATDRLQLLVGKELSLEDFKNAFAVEALNNDFFDRYKDIYEDFVQHIIGVRYEMDKKTKKYIEIKKHEPHPNFDGYKNYKDYPMPHPDSETQPFKNKEYPNLFNGNKKAVRDFVKRMMGRIVFLYFIQKKGWLAVPKGKNWGEGNYDYLYQLYKETPREDQPYFYEKRLAPLFFECFTDKKSESETNDLRFPYLNGGLFDKTQDQHFDKVNLPYSIFTELFDTFNSYNFTVYEDAPNEHTIAVDPEMLGHIFENLLEDNKDKGAFYTPKEIVHYMCKESLKNFLLSKIIPNGQSEKAKDVITKIIEHQPLNEEERKYIKEKGDVITTSLENVKICDPAIGSGAFPMGLLQEIYYIKITLQQLGITLEQTDAQIKKHIIEQNIYGVDIDAGAVDIARLRFWLSLVVDEQLPQPLPNLDFKIMQGNSLLESYQGVDLSHIGSEEEIIVDDLIDYGDEYKSFQQLTFFSEAHREKIQELIKDYFTTTEDKNLKRKEINDLIEGKIHYKIIFEKHLIEKKVNDFEKKFGISSEEELTKKLQKGILTSKGKEYKAYIANKKRLLELDYIENELISFQTKIERPYFLWHLYFKKVFDKGGFDIVIGNPPYVSTKGVPEEDKPLLEYEFGFSDDLYNHFFFKGYQILRDKGVLSFITSKTFWTTQTKRNLRDLLLSQRLEYIFDTGNPFKSAMVDTCITSFSKVKPENNILLFLDGSKDLENPLHYDVAQNVFIDTQNSVIFKPTEYNMKIHSLYGKKVKELYEQWWDKISTSKNINKYSKELEAYRQSLQSGDIALLGCLTEGGQGLATANNGKYIAVRKSTKWAKNILESRPKKLLEVVKRYKTAVKVANEEEAKDYLAALSEEQIATLFDELKEKFGRDIFGQGYIYRLIEDDEMADVETLTQDEKDNGIEPTKKFYVPYDKGDKDGNRWYLETPFAIAWSKENVGFLKSNSGKKGEGMPVVRNPQFYFKEGFCWTNVLNPQARLLKTKLKVKSVNVM